MLGNCWEGHLSQLHARMKRAFQTSTNNGREPIDKHIALDIKSFGRKNSSSTNYKTEILSFVNVIKKKTE